MRRGLLRLLMLWGIWSAAGSAAFADDTQRALDELGFQSESLIKIGMHVERPDAGRILLLEEQVKTVIQAIRTDGLAHTKTMNEYQVLILRYRYSREFFAQIRTEWTAPVIDRLLADVDQVTHDLGFDQNTAIKTVKNIFMQVFQLVNSALNEKLPPGLDDRLRSLIPELGAAIAAADLGDRPETFATATPVYQHIVALYPQFYAIRTSEPAYEDVVSIQGLAELYAEFAQLPH